MALSKQNLYPLEDQTTCEYFRALAHPARLKILRQLLTKGTICVQVIAEEHPLSLVSVSDHLKILRKAQLVDHYEQFPFTFYSLNAENLRKALELFISFFQCFFAEFEISLSGSREKGST